VIKHAIPPFRYINDNCNIYILVQRTCIAMGRLYCNAVWR